MEQTYQRLIDLINCAIKKIDYSEPLTNEEFLLLRYNQLAGVVYPVLRNQKPEILNLFKNEHFLYIKHDETQMTLIREMREILNLNQIDFVFLKGSYLKTIYPETHMRVMGDIDILVKPEDMERTHEVLNENHYYNFQNSANHDSFSKLKITVEIHPKLDSDFNDEYKSLFLEPWAHVYHVSEHEYALDIEYNFIYHIYHMIKHLYHSGVGYRTMLDLYVFLKANLAQFDIKKYCALYDVFSKKDFIDFTLYTISFLFSSIHLNVLIQNKSVLEKPIEPFVNYLFESGTHGFNKSHNMFIGDMARQKKKNELVVMTKIKFLLSRVFLKPSSMKGIYKYLNKFPFLLPVAWGQRIFRLLFRKETRDKLKYLSVDKNQLENVKDLFEQIGI